MQTEPSTRIYEALKRMVALDAGMVDGRVLPAPEREAAYATLLAETEAAFVAFAQASPRRAIDLAESVPIYDRPKRVDLARWTELAATIQRPAAVRIALAEVPDQLRDALRALDTYAAAHPGQLVLEPAASDAEIAEAEDYLGITLTPELRALYRWCNGLVWRYAAEDAEDIAPPLCLVPIHRLQRACDLVDEPPRRGRVKSLPKATARVMEHPNRLLVFDVLDGRYLSVLCADNGDQALIDDDADGPCAVSRASLAAFIAHLLDPDRVDDEGNWFPEVTDFFSE